ncbi:MAG: tRNA (adenosine(37)-N6)-dimethylallyltransferase MiaA [Victivallaceae bacterium]|nr:tRNA (adenosine(37)-N6)-dimethylallyltransferase MiaA [Victivallaceae bacterium]
MAAKHDLLVIAGPTASGKSALALELAGRLNLEIISGDSMQLYRGLDIGTAKPTATERRLVPHHLIDLFAFSERVDVFRFVKLAGDCIESVAARGNLPCVVGGTGLYLKSLIYGLDDLPADSAVRARIDAQYAAGDRFEELKKVMAARDPVSLTRWEKNQRRLLRALEVLTVSGRSISELQSGPRPARYRTLTLVLDWERDELKRRIAERTGKMLGSGWLEEARIAIAGGLLDSPTARQAIGYDLIAEYLAGNMTRNALAARIATVTWQLARRQLTWFRHQHPEAEWVECPADPDAVAERVERFFRSSPVAGRN